MKKPPIDPLGYLLAPLAAPMAYALLLPVWVFVELGGKSLWFVWLAQIPLYGLLAAVSLAISAPSLWLTRRWLVRVHISKGMCFTVAVFFSLAFSWLFFHSIGPRLPYAVTGASISGFLLNAIVFNLYQEKHLTRRCTLTPMA